MKKLKVMTIVGTRPEIIRLANVIKRLDQVADHILVHTGQNYDYELNQIFFEDLGLRQPNLFLEAAGKTATETIGQILTKVDEALEKHQPEAVLVLGDTNSGLSVIAAKKRHIPIFHMEAGNRCFDQRVPEEGNRKVIDHLSDINLTYSQIAREYLLREAFPPDRVIVTGSPICEVLASMRSKIEKSNVLKDLGLERQKYFLVSCHREENVDSEARLATLIESFNTVVKTYSMPIIFSTHPRTRKRLEASSVKLDPQVKTMKPLSFSDYNALQMNARVVLSDSGTITEESSILNFPAVTLREAHERPEGMEEASVVMSGIHKDRILQAIAMVETQKRGDDRSIKIVNDYSADNVSEKVARIILSYTDYVKRTVYGKQLIN